MAYIPYNKKKSLYNTWQSKSDNKFYYSTRWRKVRSQFLKENPICIECKKIGITTEATTVDHIIQIINGGDPYNFNNLQSLCKIHHAKKSAKETNENKIQ